VKKPRSLLGGHSLTITTTAILGVWIVQYMRSDPSKHAGSFYGNAIADWSGTLVMILATKYLYEVGSAESRKPSPDRYPPFIHFCRAHGLTIFLLITGAGWLTAFLYMDPNSKWGQVVGNIVSEWVQVLGLVLMSKHLIERNAKV
jgi:hypothetical protein